LLIKIDSSDKNYTTTNDDNLTINNLTANSEIASYNDSGFESFTFHYKGAVLFSLVQDNGRMYNKPAEKQHNIII